MKQFKLILRVAIALIIGIPTYPLGVFVCSAAFIGMVMSMSALVLYPLAALGENQDLKKDCLDGIKFFSFYFGAPIYFWYNYARTGELG